MDDEAEVRKHDIEEVEELPSNLGSKYVESTQKLAEAEEKDVSKINDVEAQIIGGLKVIAKKINTDKPIISPAKSKKVNLENYKKEKKIVVEAFNKREKEGVNNTKKVEAPKKVEKKAAPKVEKVAAPKVEKVAAPKKVEKK